MIANNLGGIKKEETQRERCVYLLYFESIIPIENLSAKRLSLHVILPLDHFQLVHILYDKSQVPCLRH